EALTCQVERLLRDVLVLQRDGDLTRRRLHIEVRLPDILFNLAGHILELGPPLSYGGLGLQNGAFGVPALPDWHPDAADNRKGRVDLRDGDAEGTVICADDYR